MISDREKLKRSVSSIPAAAALSAKDRAALVKALESLVGEHSGKVESPKLKKNIKALTEIQGQLKDLNAKFVEERAALKAKQNRSREEEHNIWLYSLKNNQVLAKELTDQDIEALNHLEDIKCSKIGNSKELKMEFIFSYSHYFENSVLTKTYHMTNDNKPILEKAIGTKIKWYPGKILTKNCQSFFNFFQPLQAADVQSRLHRDYDIFSTIWNQIIPQCHKVKKISGNSYFVDKRKTLFLMERAALEGKYQKLYEPLYKKRYEIVNGPIEVKVMKKKGTAVNKAIEEKGVPYFWATAMKNDEVLAQKITKSDEEALKYLNDIKWCRIDNSKGFKLEFFFDPNPYFENTVLTKAYHMASDDHPELEKTIGEKINWHPGKSLTASLLKRPRKRSKTAEFITKHQSFFNFFNTPKYHRFSYDSATYMYHNRFEKIEAQNEVQRHLDYELGKTIRDKIIPYAISLFTGEAVYVGTDFEDLDDDDDLNDVDNYSGDEEGEEEKEEEEEEEEEEGFYGCAL